MATSKKDAVNPMSAVLASGKPERQRAGEKAGPVSEELKPMTHQVPVSLHRRLKMASAMTDEDMRVITIRALEAELERMGY